MTHQIESTRRAIVGMIGLAGAAALAPAALAIVPTPASVDQANWQRTVAEYRRRKAAYQDASRHGEIARAYAQANADGHASAETFAAECSHAEHFGDPLWKAALAVFAFPAPTLGALAEKLEIAEAEDALEEVGSYFPADVRRLAAREA